MMRIPMTRPINHSVAIDVTAPCEGCVRIVMGTRDSFRRVAAHATTLDLPFAGTDSFAVLQSPTSWWAFFIYSSR